MTSMYQDGRYLEHTETWHVEDSPWKASQIVTLLDRNGLRPQLVGEVGCGAGQVLATLSEHPNFAQATFVGFDISQQAIDLCPSVEQGRVSFHCADPFTDESNNFDALLALDVFEHVPDYLGFLEKCQSRAEYKIYHIPLDIHVSAVARKSLNRQRESIGHLHYFTAETALATLESSGHEILDYFLTCGSVATIRNHRKPSKLVAAGPRWLASKLCPTIGARYLGGFSLLVLAK